MPRVLFFDDYPDEIDSKDLCERLEAAGLTVDCAKTTPAFDRMVRKIPYDVIILDVMATSPEPMHKFDKRDEVVPDGEIGLELLRRCRGGYYGNHAAHYKLIPIYMRTANGPAHMQSRYGNEGGTYVDPKTGDKELVRMIQRALANRQES
jgi:CheY-like chemotaxis protein